MKLSITGDIEKQTKTYTIEVGRDDMLMANLNLLDFKMMDEIDRLGENAKVSDVLLVLKMIALKVELSRKKELPA